MLLKLYSRIKNLCLNQTATVNKNPIFVIGNQKSGTSAIAVLLSEITGLSKTIDFETLNDTLQLKLRSGELPIKSFVNHNKYYFSKDIIKEPCLTLFYETLHNEFPESRCIFIVRDPRDNLRSILNRLSIAGDLDNLTDIEMQKINNINPAWRLIIDGSWLGLKGENYIEMLAARWNFASDTYLKNANNMVLIRYEDFLKNKVEAICALTKEMRLKPINKIENKIDIQYQPGGDKTVSWVDFFGERNLARIEKLCSQRMQKFGYKTKTL